MVRGRATMGVPLAVPSPAAGRKWFEWTRAVELHGCSQVLTGKCKLPGSGFGCQRFADRLGEIADVVHSQPGDVDSAVVHHVDVMPLAQLADRPQIDAQIGEHPALAGDV